MDVDDDKMQEDVKPEDTKTDDKIIPVGEEGSGTEVKKEDEMEIEEPLFQVLTTPVRVTRRQLRFLSFELDPRYKPISEHVHGIIVLQDLNPAEKEEIIEFTIPSLDVGDENEDLAPPPEAFYFS